MLDHQIGCKVVYEKLDKEGNLLYQHSKVKPHGTAEVTITIRHSDGTIKKRAVFPFRTFTANFMRVLNYAFLNVDNSTAGATDNKLIKAVTGGATYASAGIHTMALNEATLSSGGTNNYGVAIGDMDNASGLALAVESGITGIINFNDYMLRAKVLNDGGSPDTNIEYRVNNISLTSLDQLLTISRRFQNNGVNALHITESGILGKSGSDYFLISRDKIDTFPEVIANHDQDYTINATEIAEISYSFPITKSSGFTKNWLRMLSSEFVGGNALSQPVDTGASARTVNFSTARTQKDMLAAASNSLYGIAVGGWSYVPDPQAELGYEKETSTSHLIVPIAHSASGLSYGVVTPIDLTMSNNLTQFGLSRDIENLNSQNYYIYESGVIIKSGSYYFLLMNDFAIDNMNYLTLSPNEILRVKYYLQAPLV